MLETLCEHNLLKKANAELASKLTACGIRGFSQVLTSNSFKHSFLNVTQISGLGPVKPNCILVHYPVGCLETTPEGVEARSKLVSSIQSAVVCDKSLLVAMGKSWPTSDDRLQTTIDVWWFAASFAGDGGILLLIPWLLRWHPVWSQCKLRVFVISENTDPNETSTADTIEAYLRDVRIEAEVMTVPFTQSVVAPMAIDDVDMEFTDSPRPFVRAVSSSTFDSHSMRLEKCLKTWTELDVAGVQPCSQDITEAAKAMNTALVMESKDADLVLSNLPDLHLEQSSLGYCQMLTQIAHGLKRVLFVHEDTKEVITQDN